MIFYKARRPGMEHHEQSVEWFSTKREADREQRMDSRVIIEPVNVPTTRAALLKFLQKEIWR